MSDWKKKIEGHYNAKYVGLYDLPDREGPFYVFWVDSPDRSLGHDNYFGIFQHGLTGLTYITNAKSIRKARFPAIKLGEDKYLVSRFRHDYVSEGDAFLDGGLAYVRYNPSYPATHTMRVVAGYEIYSPIGEEPNLEEEEPNP
jgi:hypothetical protein